MSMLGLRVPILALLEAEDVFRGKFIDKHMSDNVMGKTHVVPLLDRL